MVVPWPQVVSRTGITVFVAFREAMRAVAMREREDSRVVLFVAPGLLNALLVRYSFSPPSSSEYFEEGRVAPNSRNGNCLECGITHWKL